MVRISPKNILLYVALLVVPLFVYIFWQMSSPETIVKTVKKYEQAGEKVRQDLIKSPTLPIVEKENTYQVVDSSIEDISIQYAKYSESIPPKDDENNQQNEQKDHQNGEEKKPQDLFKKPTLSIDFPKNYSQPINIKLDAERMIDITDLSGTSDYSVSTIAREIPEKNDLSTSSINNPDRSLFRKSLEQKLFGIDIRKIFQKTPSEDTILHYTSRDGRKSLLYTFIKDPSTGEKTLKHWTLYEYGTGTEQEQYQFSNAKVKINAEGIAEVYYFGTQEIQNEKVKSEVSPDLLARAQRAMEKETGQDILLSRNNPDFTLPAPYYIDKNGEQHNAEWQWNADKQILSVKFDPERNMYPIALDPTLSFTAPGQSNSMSMITGSSPSSFAIGDFNNDGKNDLAVGADTVVIFYGGFTFSKSVDSADVVISSTSYDGVGFGAGLVAGDFDGDNKTDLLVLGSWGTWYDPDYAVYIFYNSSIRTGSYNNADFQNSSFRGRLSIGLGDLNDDGKKDLIIGEPNNRYKADSVYIYYAGIPLSSGPQVTLTGITDTDGGNLRGAFGSSFGVGDFNADGKNDIAVSAPAFGSYYNTGQYPGWYNTYQGRIYIFYGGSITTKNALSADRVIIGEAGGLGREISGVVDLNGDGYVDILTIDTGPQKLSMFYNNAGTISTPPDVSIASAFVYGATWNDFNGDGRADFAIINRFYSSIDIIYNDGDYPADMANADVRIGGQPVFYNKAHIVSSGDLNGDGQADIVTNSQDGSNTSILYSQNGQVNTNQYALGEASGDAFGTAMVAGDFNADGTTDLAVGAPAGSGHSSNTGRVYLFYNRGSYPRDASSADVIIDGGAIDDFFGFSLIAGDFNGDKKIDFAVGSPGSSLNTGSTYVFYADGTNDFGTIFCTSSFPTLCSASNADVILTGGLPGIGIGSSFGTTLTTGDFNSDGKMDLAIGATGYSSNTGSVSVFYAPFSGVNVTLTGENVNDLFGKALIAGDFNHDNRTDLAVGATGYSSATGRVYLFYNSGSTLPTTASLTITGSQTTQSFGYALAVGDFNADNSTDLVVGTHSDFLFPRMCTDDPSADFVIYYPCNYYDAGRVYIFYGDSTIPTTANTADIILDVNDLSATAQPRYFGSSLATGDLNADGKIDLVIGQPNYDGTTYVGLVRILYNDGALGTDVTIKGWSNNSFLGTSLVTGDFNANGRTNLVVGEGLSVGAGRISFFETRDNFVWNPQTLSLAEGATMKGDMLGQEQRISGSVNAELFGSSLASGDFNNDGKNDLAVGASGSSSLYIFYADGEYPVRSSDANVVIKGMSVTGLGTTLIAGDFNDDGKTDIATSNLESVYIFYNDGSYPLDAVTADVVIAGETAYSSGSAFGSSMVSEDMNDDGKKDLVIGSYGYSTSAFTATNTGRVYIYYANGTRNFVCTTSPCTASDADVIINGSEGSYFGYQIVTGDFNTDNKTDLTVSAPFLQTSNTGRVYIFYVDGTNNFGTTSCVGTPALCNASDADVTIMSEVISSMNIDGLGYSIASGDLNNDGKIDLAIGTQSYCYDDITQGCSGRMYLIYNQGSGIYPANAGGADVIIAGGQDSFLGRKIAIGDVNRDNREDLLVWRGDVTSTHYLDVFLNDGSGYPTNLSGIIESDVNFTYPAMTNDMDSSQVIFDDLNADGYQDLVISDIGFNGKGKISLYTTNDTSISGEATGNYFGSALAIGDFNADGKKDLAVGAPGYSSNTGRVYIFYNDNHLPSSAFLADAIITGETTGDQFGKSISLVDFNIDGEQDLVVGASGYSTSKGSVYFFANLGTGVYPVSASGRDTLIVGEADNNYFGEVLASDDMDHDGWADMVVGARGYLSNAGRVYMFYSDGVYPATSDLADSIITGETGILFGSALATGDFDRDGKKDVAVSAPGYSSNTGRVYIFYYNVGLGTFPSTVATANATITGSLYTLPVPCYFSCTAFDPYFGSALVSSDFNNDGKTDLAVGSYNYGFQNWDRDPMDIDANLTTYHFGRVDIFYNTATGIYPTSASNANVTMVPESNSYLGSSLSVGDVNADKKADLIADVANGVFVFYNDGAYPDNAYPDIRSVFEPDLRPSVKVNTPHISVVGDFNDDGKGDIVTGIGEYYYYGPLYSQLLNTTGYVTTTISEVRTIDRFLRLRLRGTAKFQGQNSIR